VRAGVWFPEQWLTRIIIFVPLGLSHHKQLLRTNREPDNEKDLLIFCSHTSMKNSETRL